MSRKLVLLTALIIVLVGMLSVALEFRIVYSSPYTNVDVDTAYNMIMNGSYPDLVVLDVRTKSEYDSGHIYGAVWIPHTELKTRISELAGHENHEIITYCRSGVRSVNASETLDSFNFTKVFNMLGGILAWESGGHPTWIATVHNLNTTLNYDTIQAAIDANETLDGHTIFVEEGTYYEHVVINKCLSLIGEDKYMTILDGNMTSADVVIISADNVVFDNFTVQKSVTSGLIILRSNVTVRNNRILSNSLTGIGLDPTCNGSAIVENTVTHNGNGITLLSSSSNEITNNTISYSQEVAILLQGTPFGNCSYNNIKHNVVINNRVGIYLVSAAPKNVICHNVILDNDYGMGLDEGFGDNIIAYNTFTNHLIGIKVYNYSTNNVFHHNIFVKGIVQVYNGSVNVWDNGLEGNYWSHYAGVDLDDDGIGDDWYEIAGNNTDYYPLMGIFHTFNVSLNHSVDVISNSTIEDFQYFESNNTIKMYVSNLTTGQTFGFCRVRIPHALMNETYYIRINGTEPYYWNYSLYDDGDNRWIYFSYQHSILEIVIIPEFPSFLILPLFMIITLLAVILNKKSIPKSLFSSRYSLV